MVAAKGTVNVTALVAVLAADTAIPAAAKAMFEQMGQHIDALDQRVAALDGELAALHKANPVSQLLAEIPGVGPIGAITMALTVEPGNFASGRHFAAWLGLTPKEHSTGGKQRMGKISKAGNERLRQLFGCWRHVRRPLRQAGQQVCLGVASAIAGAQAAQARRGRSGQQERPDHLGDDVAWGSIPASAGRRLNRARLPGV
jgi:transposase